MLSSSSTSASSPTGLPIQPAKPSDEEQRAELKQVFTEFTAGTFYREMLKALRKSHTKPAYFDGGHAEEIFRDQLDRQISDSLASDHGDHFAGPMFDSFAHQALHSSRL